MSSPVRAWVDLSPELDRGLKAAARTLHLSRDAVIQQAIKEFLQHRGLLPVETAAPTERPRASRGLVEMALAREGR